MRQYGAIVIFSAKFYKGLQFKKRILALLGDLGGCAAMAAHQVDGKESPVGRRIVPISPRRPSSELQLKRQSRPGPDDRDGDEVARSDRMQRIHEFRRVGGPASPESGQAVPGR